MFRKLWPRLMISHALPILILLPIISLVLLYLLETRYSLGNLAGQLIAQGTLITEFTQEDVNAWTSATAAREIIERLSPHISGRLMLLDKNGRLLSSSMDADTPRLGQIVEFPAVQQALQAQTNWQVGYSPFMLTRIIDMGMPVLDDNDQVLGVVRLSYDISQLEQNTVSFRWLVGITIFAGTTIALLLGLLLARSLSSPLAQLTNAFKQLKPGDPPATLLETGPDEVKTLALNFNQMTQRLHALEKSRQQLLANIVHELGTPLGAIKAAAQALENGAISEPQLASELAIGISSQVDQLRLLIDDLTLLSETEIRDLVLHRQSINLEELLQIQCRSYTWLLDQKHITLLYDPSNLLPRIEADANRISQILANLLHNAYKFTPSHGQIKITTALEDNRQFVRVCVRDTGPGIEDSEQSKIFELLYRSPGQRNLYKGMGIGLALSRRLAEAHGGSLAVESQPGYGATFTLRLPVPSQL